MTSGIESTILRKGESMKRSSLPDTNTYIVAWKNDGKNEYREIKGARRALEIYRFMRCVYGDTTRLLKVVVDYGQEV